MIISFSFRKPSLTVSDSPADLQLLMRWNLQFIIRFLNLLSITAVEFFVMNICHAEKLSFTHRNWLWPHECQRIRNFILIIIFAHNSYSPATVNHGRQLSIKSRSWRSLCWACSICWGENQDADSGFMNVSNKSCGLVISIPLEGLCDITARLNFR